MPSPERPCRSVETRRILRNKRDTPVRVRKGVSVRTSRATAVHSGCSTTPSCGVGLDRAMAVSAETISQTPSPRATGKAVWPTLGENRVVAVLRTLGGLGRRPGEEGHVAISRPGRGNDQCCTHSGHSRHHQATARSGGFRSFPATAANGEVAPKAAIRARVVELAGRRGKIEI